VAAMYRRPKWKPASKDEIALWVDRYRTAVWVCALAQSSDISFPFPSNRVCAITRSWLPPEPLGNNSLNRQRCHTPPGSTGRVSRFDKPLSSCSSTRRIGPGRSWSHGDNRLLMVKDRSDIRLLNAGHIARFAGDHCLHPAGETNRDRNDAQVSKLRISLSTTLASPDARPRTVDFLAHSILMPISETRSSLTCETCTRPSMSCLEPDEGAEARQLGS